MYTYREARTSDFETICRFSQNEDELFVMFPRASYPLTVLQLGECASERYEPSVFLSNGQIADYANIIRLQKGENGSIGNIVVAPAFRDKG